MRKLKHLELFENWGESESTKLSKFLRTYDIYNYKINDDGSIDIDGDCIITNMPYDTIPFKINKVDGDFKLMTSNVTSLKNSPTIIDGRCEIVSNPFLLSLDGISKEISDTISIENNHRIKNLIGLQDIVYKSFLCTRNINLTSLEGCPRIINGNIDITNNNITNLKFFPEYVKNDCRVCRTRITNLTGLPDTIHGDLIMNNNEYITTLEGLPKLIKGGISLAWASALESLDKFINVEGKNINLSMCNINNIENHENYHNKIIDLSFNLKLTDLNLFKTFSDNNNIVDITSTPLSVITKIIGIDNIDDLSRFKVIKKTDTDRYSFDIDRFNIFCIKNDIDYDEVEFENEIEKYYDII